MRSYLLWRLWTLRLMVPSSRLHISFHTGSVIRWLSKEIKTNQTRDRGAKYKVLLLLELERRSMHQLVSVLFSVRVLFFVSALPPTLPGAHCSHHRRYAWFGVALVRFAG